MHSWIRQRRDHFWRLVVPTAMTIALTTSDCRSGSDGNRDIRRRVLLVPLNPISIRSACSRVSWRRFRDLRAAKPRTPLTSRLPRAIPGILRLFKSPLILGVVTYRELVDTFWRSIDPTDSGGQFCDRGHSYTTAVFVMDEQQKMAATESKRSAIRSLGSRIVTPVREASTFYPADEKHQDYYLGTNRVLTRFGVIKQSDAYKRYRKACGRDERVRELWGDQAIFAGDH